MNGCDNFPTRYLANDACVMLKKPLVDGAIWQFEGQATVFNPPKGPCYRCLFPEPPPPGAVPSCAEAGVLGVLPGLVGCVQALEAIKLILGRGQAAARPHDALRHALGRGPHAEAAARSEVPVCGEHPTVKQLIDYEVFCGLAGPGQGQEHAA